jgi:serine/threonine protein phosphatase PrpC
MKMSWNFKTKRNFVLGYSTIKGENHKKIHAPNQDAVLVKKDRFGVVLVVADGVGSHKYAHYGSRGIVKAVQKAFLSHRISDGKQNVQLIG